MSRNILRAAGVALIALLASGSLVVGQTSSTSREKDFSYTLFRFSRGEGWTLSSKGDKGTSGLSGNKLSFDFSGGTEYISVLPTPVSMLGNVSRIRLKVKGNGNEHPVHLYIQSHFMIFHKVIGTLPASGEKELITDAPPGNGWMWFDGENDGQVHGPLRLLEIRIEENNKNGKGDLELVSMSVEGHSAENKQCVFTAGASGNSLPVTFKANIRTISGTPLSGNLNWTIRDWDKSVIGKGSRKVTLQPGGKETDFIVPTGIKDLSLKFAEAIISLDIPGQTIPDADACWLAPLEKQNDTTQSAGSSFGMGAYLGRYHGKELEEMGRKAGEMGVKWIREDFAWLDIEPEKGKYNWAFTDSVVHIAVKNGIQVYAIVAYWPSWTKPYTKEGIDDYISFLKKIVSRYRNSIHQWEIWNEPNIFFWQGPEDMYAELLMKSYITIKDIDPSAEVLGLSTSGIDFPYIKKMLSLQAPFDVLTIHPYRSVLEEEEFISELKAAADMVALPDGKRRPVWITEMGWTTYNPHNWWVQEGFVPTPLRVQAELIVRTYLSCILSGINPKVFWYDLRNDGTDPYNFEDNIGIMNRDFTPKPAYAAYAVMTKTLKGMRFVKSPDLGENIYAGMFEDEAGSGRKVLALWSHAKDNETDIFVSNPEVTIINAVGESSKLKGKASAGAYMVHVRLQADAPVYIVDQLSHF
jgi:hypothetical protein